MRKPRIVTLLDDLERKLGAADHDVFFHLREIALDLVRHHASLAELDARLADGDSAASLGLTGEEEFSITGLAEPMNAGELPRTVSVRAGDTEFAARVRIDTPKEAEYFRHGGILQYVLRSLLGRDA